MRTKFLVGSLSLAIATIAIANILPANAQLYGPVGEPGDGIAPLYTNPVFHGDYRANDLYGYLHPVDSPEWNTYQMLVRQIDMQDQGNIYQQPSLATSMAGGFGPGASTSVSGVILPSSFNNAPGLVHP